MDAVDWNAAIDGLMRFGRADDLDAMLVQREKALRSRTSAEEQRDVPKLRNLGAAARDFADSLATGRVHHLLTSAAPRLVRDLTSTGPALAEHARPVEQQVERLRAWAEQLSAPSVISPEGLAATRRLIELFGELQRFSEQVALLRERMIDEWTLSRLAPTEVLQPGCGDSAFGTQRHQLDKDLGAASRGRAPGVSRRFAALSQLRNDVEHCGYRPDPRKPRGVREQIREAVNATPRSFLNLSNHPSSLWSSEQRESALALGGPEIIDQPFPVVPPEDNEATVAALAARLVDEILDRSPPPAAAFVGGEPALTASVVALLQSAGVRCYTATTRRETTEQVQPDGSTRKEATFRFERWRAFPRLALTEPTSRRQDQEASDE